jgi:hypothetical protein
VLLSSEGITTTTEKEDEEEKKKKTTKQTAHVIYDASLKNHFTCKA